VRPGWPGPPLHHHAFDETFCILEGELTFQLGADRLVGRPGDTLFVPRGVHHTLANLAESPAKYLLVYTPGGFEQRFGPEADSTPSGPNTDVIVVGPRIRRWTRSPSHSMGAGLRQVVVDRPEVDAY
jgi:uncharacterized cupin superfamily protein